MAGIDATVRQAGSLAAGIDAVELVVHIALGEATGAIEEELVDGESYPRAERSIIVDFVGEIEIAARNAGRGRSRITYVAAQHEGAILEIVAGLQATAPALKD